MLTAREAVDALKEGRELLEGPWPVRRFAVTDGDNDATAFGRSEFYKCLKSLMAEGYFFRVSIERADSRWGRFAVVVWAGYVDLEGTGLYAPIIRDYGTNK
jgi:hypothetical protein